MKIIITEQPYLDHAPDIDDAEYRAGGYFEGEDSALSNTLKVVWYVLYDTSEDQAPCDWNTSSAVFHDLEGFIVPEEIAFIHTY